MKLFLRHKLFRIKLQTTITNNTLKHRFLSTRERTEKICESLKPEDTAVQPIIYVSPPKWHLAHTTWFFEQFVLTEYAKDYKVFDDDFSFYFNSYYNNVGSRVLRPDRGLMTRPTLDEIMAYRAYVNKHMSNFMSEDHASEIESVIEIGLQHEEQHQELLIYDIKYIFGHQPAFPVLDTNIQFMEEIPNTDFLRISEGVYKIGHQNENFCFDNELGVHKTYIQDFEISRALVMNSEYIEFIEDGGYSNFNLWHADGWEHIQSANVKAPLYWHKVKDKWMYYTLQGFKAIEKNKPVCHISFYEASAFAQWKGMRLPTEFEWEVASEALNYGQLWEWTNSAYLPYPGYTKADGAIGEYNGKFMVNQMVLRGASIATPKQHSRPTYRNFFHPDMRWQFSGIRLAK